MKVDVNLLHEDSTMRIADASDLQLKPGEWPRTLEVADRCYVAQHREVRDGELLWIDYYNAERGSPLLRLRIFND